MSSELDGRCGTCARFVRVVESIDANGEVRRTGECLLGVWPTPLKETSALSTYAPPPPLPARIDHARPHARPASRMRPSFSSSRRICST